MIKENYFNGGLKEEVADKYIMCQTVMGLSMIKCGNIPQFLGEESVGIFQLM